MGLVMGSVDAERRAEALGERGLAGPEVAGQQEQVAGSGQLGQRGGQRLGLVDRRAVQQRRITRSVDAGCRRHERLLGPHEVGPHLGQRLAAAPQDVGRVQRRDQHAVAERVALARAAW